MFAIKKIETEIEQMTKELTKLSKEYEVALAAIEKLKSGELTSKDVASLVKNIDYLR